MGIVPPGFKTYSGVHRGTWEGDQRAEPERERLLGLVPPPAAY
jgi:hypothetical protein